MFNIIHTVSFSYNKIGSKAYGRLVNSLFTAMAKTRAEIQKAHRERTENEKRPKKAYVTSKEKSNGYKNTIEAQLIFRKVNYKKDGKQLKKALPNTEKQSVRECQVTSHSQIAAYSHPKKSQRED